MFCFYIVIYLIVYAYLVCHICHKKLWGRCSSDLRYLSKSCANNHFVINLLADVSSAVWFLLCGKEWTFPAYETGNGWLAWPIGKQLPVNYSNLRFTFRDSLRIEDEDL